MTEIPSITFYEIHSENNVKIEQSSPKRKWMDETPNKYAYRCVPLSVANNFGWVFKSPVSFKATWTGGPSTNDIELNGNENYPLVSSHFGCGILTFHIGYLVETTPGWGIWVRGEPNTHKEGIVPLDGFVESDWIPFTFTMNWRFTKPGTIFFEKDEPFCFITMMDYRKLSETPVSVKPLSSNPVLSDEYSLWSKMRNDFNTGLSNNNADIVKQGWQKFYARGKSPGNLVAPAHHTTKRILKKPE